MSRYTFKGGETKHGVPAFARRCGLVYNKRGNGFYCRGDVSPAAARAFADYLEKSRLSYEWTRPPYNELVVIDLADVVSADNRRAREEVYRLTQGKRTVADLGYCSFNDILAVQHTFPNWSVLTSVIRFMIDHDIDFRDLSPRERFKTPVESLELTTHTHNRLLSAGLVWVELLECATPGGLLGIRQFGEGALAEVRRTLAMHGKRLHD